MGVVMSHFGGGTLRIWGLLRRSFKAGGMRIWELLCASFGAGVRGYGGCFVAGLGRVAEDMGCAMSELWAGRLRIWGLFEARLGWGDLDMGLSCCSFGAGVDEDRGDGCKVQPSCRGLPMPEGKCSSVM